MSTKASSILARIDDRGRIVPRVQLKDVGAEEAALTEIELRSTGRYEILGQIAEGGIGQVLKGRDTDLGRDVAMKVLRADRMGSVELLQRFVEEAQIGGQLQHPGIVPVYELGLHEGKQPYFAMKLVKGRTLSALLEERNGPADRRRHFLSIFVQVCQTMAYAHSRNVIHRDLKPSNIMVGSFGEVQVVDWGFAKVLREGGVADEKRASRAVSGMTHVATLRSAGDGSQSIAGSVMGTPAYMPPEQALGHIDELDSRSDVFSLGAILCEILTGGPVYLGPSEDLLMKAAKGQTDEAVVRLDKSGADPDIVDLAKSCLAPLRKDRPRDALLLAQRVGVHLASAEERVQKSKLSTIESRKKTAATQAQMAEAKAKVEAARAETAKRKAQAERTRRQADRAGEEAEEANRSRKQLRILGAAVLVALAIGVGAYSWIVDGRRAEAQKIAARVHEDLTAARRLKGESKWADALTAAKRAAADAPEDVEATELIAAIEKARDRVSAREARLAHDRAFIAKVEEIRARGTDGVDALRTDRDYAAAFRGHEIDLDKLQPKQAAQRIRKINDWRRVVEALDDRLWLRGSWVEAKGSNKKALVALLRAIDSDPWRDRLRDARFEGLPHVRKLAAEVGRQKALPPHTILLAGTALGAVGDTGGALQFLQAAYRDHPDHPWMAVRIATYLAEQGRTTEALRYYGGALAHQTKNLFLRVAVARTLRLDGKVDQAVEFCKETLRHRADSPHAHLALGIALFASGNKSAGEQAYRKAAELAPGKGWVHDDWGLAVGELNDRVRRLKAWQEALQVQPRMAHVHAQLGSELSVDGEYQAAIAELREAVTIEPKYYAGWLLLGVVLAAAERQDESLEATTTAVALQPQDWTGQVALGYALHRSGDRKKALEAFQKAVELAPGQAGAQVTLGDALLGQGELHEALKAYFKAIKIDNTDRTLTSLAYGFHANGDLGQAEIAAREALALNPEYTDAQIVLGSIFVGRGMIDQGIKELNKALALDGASSVALRAMGYAHYYRDDPRKALEFFQKAFEARPGSAAALVGIGRARELQGDVAGAREAYERGLKSRSPADSGYYPARAGCQLGLLLLRKGKFGEALTALRGAHKLAESAGYWDLPSEDWVEACEAMAKLEEHLPGVRDGTYEPKDVEEKAHLARMCSLLKRDDLAVRLFAETFAEDEDLAYITTGNRLHAARSAARLAAASGNADARRKALAWLQAEVKDHAVQLWDIYPTTRAWAREVMQGLHLDDDFTGWRSSARLANVPEKERAEWRALWAQLDVALAKPSK